MATIVMLTSGGHRGDAGRCQELGVAAYLLKPVRQSQLREAIARALGVREKDAAAPLITRVSLQDTRQVTRSLRVLLAESRTAVERLLDRAQALAARLPGTMALFRSGRLRQSKVTIIVDKTGTLMVRLSSLKRFLILGASRTRP